MPEPIDTSNEFQASLLGDDVVILKPPRRISKAAALRLAANLVALADDDGTFPAILEAVQNS